VAETRSKLLKFNPFRFEILDVKVPCEDGSTEILRVKVRQPSVGQRTQILAARIAENDAKALARAQALAVVLCSLEPDGSDKPVFEMSDVDALIDGPAGGWVDQLANKAMALVSEGADAAKK
jgi:hypothetical protein